MLMSHFIIGTAGHIDHGKTTLVKALTGIDTDRLKEEKERGITIDLGFAYWKDGITIIDVPGHERFIRNMVAGVSSIDFVLLVIAADDGIMPQTVEHFDILKLLHIRAGAVVITKTDLVPETKLKELESEVGDFIKGSFLEKARVFRISVAQGNGVDTLSRYLEHEAAKSAPRKEHGFFRMNIDRRFAMKGFGTVVTGTVLAGAAGVDEILEILPLKKQVRIRGIQKHNQNVETVHAGDRAALNITGIETDKLERGYLLSAVGQMKAAPAFYAKVHCLKSAKKPVVKAMRARLHIGTAELFCKIDPVERPIYAGQDGYVKITPEISLACIRGDRFILREANSSTTFGGGVILHHVRPDTKAGVNYLSKMQSENLSESLACYISFHKTVTLTELVSVFGLEKSVIDPELAKLEHQKAIRRLENGERTFADYEFYIRLRDLIVNKLTVFHTQNSDEKGMKKSQIKAELEGATDQDVFEPFIQTLKTEGFILDEKDMLRLASHKIKIKDKDQALMVEIELKLKQNPFSPPSLEIVSAELKQPLSEVLRVARMMGESGVVVKTSENLYFHADAEKEARQFVIDFIHKKGHIKITDFKDRYHTSRKFALSLLEYFDSIQVTSRNGDSRVLYHS